jgi:hypothetical protein
MKPISSVMCSGAEVCFCYHTIRRHILQCNTVNVINPLEHSGIPSRVLTLARCVFFPHNATPPPPPCMTVTWNRINRFVLLIKTQCVLCEVGTVISLFESCCVSWLVVPGRQHNKKNKPIERFILFDSCYMFRSAYKTIFRQSHQMRLLLSNCPFQCYSSQ